ncbi:MAG: hypothetical protein AAGA47_10780 [Pseudomonadota bacterium]
MRFPGQPSHWALITEDDELTCVFRHPETASLYFLHERVNPGKALDIPGFATDDAAFHDCLGSEQIAEPDVR